MIENVVSISDSVNSTKEIIEMEKKIKFYIATVLTTVTEEKDRALIRRIVESFRNNPEYDLLEWAFDVEAWNPKGDRDNIYEEDKMLILESDIVVFLFVNSLGSDGRGSELEICLNNEKPLIALAKEGEKISAFTVHCLEKSNGVKIQKFFTADKAIRIIDKALWDFKYQTLPV